MGCLSLALSTHATSRAIFGDLSPPIPCIRYCHFSSLVCRPVRRGGTHTLHALAARPMPTRPREDGALSPPDRSPMANCSLQLCQSWRKKNVFPMLTTSLLAFFRPLLIPQNSYRLLLFSLGRCLHRFLPSQATHYPPE